MLRSLVKSLRVVLILVVLLAIYYAGCQYLSESIVYRGRVESFAGNNTIISNILTRINSNDKTLPESSSSSKNVLAELHPPTISADINRIYFTVKTTPGNYEKRIRPLQISWFQKVNKDMVSDARDS